MPVERQIRGLHSARLWERDAAPTAAFLTGVLGFAPQGEENGWQRFALLGGGSGRVLDLRAAPGERRGAWGVGAIHHLAWRVEDDEHQMDVRQRVEAAIATRRR